MMRIIKQKHGNIVQYEQKRIIVTSLVLQGGNIPIDLPFI